MLSANSYNMDDGGTNESNLITKSITRDVCKKSFKTKSILSKELIQVKKYTTVRFAVKLLLRKLL